MGESAIHDPGEGCPRFWVSIYLLTLTENEPTSTPLYTVCPKASCWRLIRILILMISDSELLLNLFKLTSCDTCHLKKKCQFPFVFVTWDYTLSPSCVTRWFQTHSLWDADECSKPCLNWGVGCLHHLGTYWVKKKNLHNFYSSFLPFPAGEGKSEVWDCERCRNQWLLVFFLGVSPHCSNSSRR